MFEGIDQVQGNPPAMTNDSVIARPELRKAFHLPSEVIQTTITDGQ